MGLLWFGVVCSSLADIADYIYQKKSPLDLSLQGIWIADREWPTSSEPSSRVSFLDLLAELGWNVVQGQIPAVDFVHKYEHVFAFKCILTPLEI